jgi:hypothetical protein
MRAAQIATRYNERRFPVRIRIGVPPTGLGKQLTQMQDWLDHNAGADGWAMTPSGQRGVLNDALSIHLSDAAIASAFVARWCIGYRPETADGYTESGRTSRKPAAEPLITRHRNPSDADRVDDGALRRARLREAALILQCEPLSYVLGGKLVGGRLPIGYQIAV